ncbi:MAG: plasmid pRiA4b ORF-3 family protein [Actinomycetota bacterium]|nr:plasmid pRiA4b ORF-3 family protein [Actinomycetota bacterium]
MRTFDLHVTLQDIDPPVWRLVRVPDTLTLAGLHATIQAAFGWQDCHLHSFETERARYEPAAGRHHMDPALPEEGTTLADLAHAGVREWDYLYDFGDDWLHTIRIEETHEAEESDQVVPLVLAGERACPPEDCGGPYGYEALLETLADPEAEDHAESAAWAATRPDRPFDPEAFDIAATNVWMLTAVDPHLR